MLDLVPAYVGLLHGAWEAFDFARQDAQAFLSALGGEIEEDLEAHADPEKGFSIGNLREHGVKQPAIPKSPHGRRCGALAGKHQGVCCSEICGVGGNTGVVAQPSEGLLNASEVAGSVVDDEDEGA